MVAIMTLVNRYGMYVAQMSTDMSSLTVSLKMTCYCISKLSNTMDDTSGAGTAYPSGASEFNLGF